MSYVDTSTERIAAEKKAAHNLTNDALAARLNALAIDIRRFDRIERNVFLNEAASRLANR